MRRKEGKRDEKRGGGKEKRRDVRKAEKGSYGEGRTEEEEEVKV